MRIWLRPPKWLHAASRSEAMFPIIRKGSYAPEEVQRLIYPKAADGDALRQRMADRWTCLIAPQLRSRRRKVQDRRKRRRYRRRWKMGVCPKLSV